MLQFRIGCSGKSSLVGLYLTRDLRKWEVIHVEYLEDHSGEGNSKCKGPEAGEYLVHLRNSKKSVRLEQS